MKIIFVAVAFLFVFFCSNIYPGYCQNPMPMIIKTVDVNKDGRPDVKYYGEGKNVTKVEADTNYDGKPDIIIQAQDGKFKSAEVDTNNDGKPDKKFDNAAEFKKWVNENRADFSDELNDECWPVLFKY